MSDYLLDRLQLKSKISFWRNVTIAVIMVAIMIIVTNNNNNKATALQTNHIARIDISGEIVEDANREKVLKTIAENDKIKAVIMHLDTPGGTAYGGESLYYSIKKISAKKPVVAVIGTMAASAGYMTAVSADAIFARNTSLTGSIGALIMTAEFSELAKKLGVGFIVVQSGDLKAEPLFTHPLTDKAKAAATDLIMNTYNIFVDLVSIGRNLKKEDVIKLADGRLYTGQQAYENKLVDAIGGEQEAIEWLIANKKIDKSLQVKDVELYEPEDLIGRFSSPLRKFSESAASITALIKPLQYGTILK